MRKKQVILNTAGTRTYNEVVITVETSLNQVLAVVTEQFHRRQHGKAPVLELIELAGLQGRGIDVSPFSGFEVTQEAIVICGANGDHDLCPAKSWNSVNGCDTVRDVCELESGSDFTRESVDLLCDIANDTQHSNAAVFEFSRAILVERRFVNVG